MDTISLSLLQKALDGLSRRYAYTAQNIANANTPNYQPVHVAFEESLRAAASGGAVAIERVSPTIIETPSGEGEMRLDLELAAAAQTAMRYRALIEILARRLALSRSALSPVGQ